MAKYISNRQKNLKVGLSSYSENLTSLEVVGKVGIGTTNATSSLYVVGDEYVTGVVTATTFYGTLSGNASSATYATSAGIATYATSSGIATYATNAGVSTYATSAGIATYATNAGVSTYATSSGIATYATSSGIATYATSSGIATYATSAGIATYATSSGIATYATSSGIATYATSSGIATYATSSGIATYATSAGIATYATTAGVATALQNARNFSITGNFVTATAISFDGTGNVALAATIPLDAIGLGTYTTGDYVKNISGTSNQITVTSGTGEGSTPTLSIPSQFTAPQDVTVTRDLQVNRNLNVTGNITIGGTTAFINVQELVISDPDIILGYRTDSNGNDVSNDTTSNHGGVALASTEGNPLVNLFIAGIETAPATYKKIMWFKSGTFSGLGTDAWLINYAVGIGSTQFPSGTRLAAGSVQFSENDLRVVRNINSSGIVTATTFVGALTGTATTATNLADAANITTGTVNSARLSGTYSIDISGNAATSGYATTAGIATYATSAGIATYATSSGIATYATNAGVSTYATSSGIATYATSAGIATYATIAGYSTSSGVSTSVIGGIASVTQLNVSGLSTFSGITTHTTSLFGTDASFTGVVTATKYFGDGSSLTGITAAGSGVVINNNGSTVGTASTIDFSTGLSVVFASGIATVSVNNVGYANTAGIATYATLAGVSTSVIGGIGSITQLQVTGVSTFTNGPIFVGSGTSTGTSSQPLQVTGGAYVSGSVGVGTTNPTQTLHVQGNARVTGGLYDSNNNVGTAGSVLSSTGSGLSWIPAPSGGGGGAGTTFFGAKFDTNIDNTLYIQPTGTLDIVGVGTTTTQITTFPAGSTEYIIHSIHVTNISNGDAEITGGFLLNSRAVPASISVSVGQSGSAGVNTVTVGSGSTILVGMSVFGTGNIGETTGIGSTAGFQFNTYVTSVDGNIVSLSKPMSGRAVGVATFVPTSRFASRLPVPVGSAVELLKQPFILGSLDSIVLQSTGAGTGVGSTSTAAISQTANSNILTVTAGAAITNFIAAGQLIQGTGSNTGIQTNTYVGVGYIPGSLSVPMTRPATSTLASQILSFTEVVTPQDGALQATIVYQTTTDTSFQNGVGIASTTPIVYYGTGNTYPAVIQSIRVTNISDGFIYPGGDYPVWVGIGNSDTIFSWLAYNMIIPKNSSIELCEAPKRLGIGQSIFAYALAPNTIEIQVAAKQKTT